MSFDHAWEIYLGWITMKHSSGKEYWNRLWRSFCWILQLKVYFLRKSSHCYDDLRWLHIGYLIIDTWKYLGEFSRALDKGHLSLLSNVNTIYWYSQSPRSKYQPIWGTRVMIPAELTMIRTRSERKSIVTDWCDVVITGLKPE